MVKINNCELGNRCDCWAEDLVFLNFPSKPLSTYPFLYLGPMDHVRTLRNMIIFPRGRKHLALFKEHLQQNPTAPPSPQAQIRPLQSTFSNIILLGT